MRLDKYLYENGFYPSRNKALEGIERNEVFVNGKIAEKPSYSVVDTDIVTISEEKKPYVSLGGYKLEKAINFFSPKIDGKVFIDVGASTGGFTDCLLRFGAKRVYCVDVGKDQLAPELAADCRTRVMDGVNARFLSERDFDEKADGIVVDCSFISLEYVLPPLPALICADGYILALIKPQFETGGAAKMKNGILRNDSERAAVIKRIYSFVVSQGLCFKGICLVTTDSKKNKEYVAYITKSGESMPIKELLSAI